MNTLPGRVRHPRLRYAEGVRSVNRLEQTEVCQSCGRPYLIASGHTCRPRTRQDERKRQ